MKPEDVPNELIRPAAEVLLRQYDQEFNAAHLRWQDFAYAASEVLAAVLPVRDAQIEREVRAKVAADIEATQREWSEIEGDARCDAYADHQCHRIAGELTFAEAARIARGERP